MQRKSSLLEVDRLTVRFGGVTALSNVDLAIERGTIHGLIGPNGAGKTTLLNAVSRAVQPESGSIRFDGEDILRVPTHGLMRLGIARTFQNLVLLSDASALDNVIVGLHATRYQTLFDEVIAIPRRIRAQKAVRRRALEMLAYFGLAQQADIAVGQLPYGLRKNVEMARACASRPKLLMLDEPTAGLSSVEMEKLKHSLLDLRRDHDLTILVISHHVEFLLGLAEATTVLDLGEVIARGSPAEIRADPKVVQAYLGVQK